MKSNYVLSSLCLAPLALAAPVSHTVTLIAGKAVWKPGHQTSTFFEKVQQVIVSEHSSPTVKESAPSIVAAERPMTTAELMELSKVPSQPTPPQQMKSPKPKSAKDSNKKISVGALVVPSSSRAGVLAKIFDPQTSPYLIPGQYVASQRADVLIVGLILACVLVVMAMESWELVSNIVSSGTFRRGGPIRLDDSNESAADLEGKNWESDDEDDCDAPFGGFRKHHNEEEGLRLPEKVDEKAAWI